MLGPFYTWGFPRRKRHEVVYSGQILLVHKRQNFGFFGHLDTMVSTHDERRGCWGAPQHPRRSCHSHAVLFHSAVLLPLKYPSKTKLIRLLYRNLLTTTFICSLPRSASLPSFEEYKFQKFQLACIACTTERKGKYDYIFYHYYYLDVHFRFVFSTLAQ